MRGEARRLVAATLLAPAALIVAALALPALAAAADRDTVWLCRPGMESNPCHGSLETTVVSPDGSEVVNDPANAADPKADCFYVYPTVSNQPGPNADKTVGPEQIAIAHYQAARFSRVCRVYAPIYRQLTLSALELNSTEESKAAIELAYSDVVAAWRDYIHHYNDGRPVILLGHSQGSGMLTGVLRNEIETHKAQRRRLVSAILLGGNVTTPRGETVGGSFRKTPICENADQTGCVISFSTYNETPPDDTRFGAGGNRFHDVYGTPFGPKQETVCTNPASLGANERVPLRQITRTEGFAPGLLAVAGLILYAGPPPSAATPWLTPVDRYTGKCETENGAHVLMVEGVGEVQQPLHPSPDDTWGLHLLDMQIGLGDLIDVTREQVRSFVRNEQGKRARR